jgi:hypothetical protein
MGLRVNLHGQCATVFAACSWLGWIVHRVFRLYRIKLPLTRGRAKYAPMERNGLSLNIGLFVIPCRPRRMSFLPCSQSCGQFQIVNI